MKKVTLPLVIAIVIISVGLTVLFLIRNAATSQNDNKLGERIEAEGEPVSTLPDGQEETDAVKETEEAKITELNSRVNPAEAQKILAAKGEAVIWALKNKDMITFSNFVHPKKGVSFSPRATIYPSDCKFSREEVENFFSEKKVSQWGDYYETADHIELKTTDYFQKYVYDHDYAQEAKVYYNRFHDSTLYIENYTEFFTNPLCLEYFIKNTGKAETDYYDHFFLRIIWEEYNKEWFIVAIAHNVPEADIEYSMKVQQELEAFFQSGEKLVETGTGEPKISPDEAKMLVGEKPGLILKCIKNRDFTDLAGYVHPVKGLRFSMYSFVNGTDRVFQAKDVMKFNTDKTRTIWGAYDGSGFAIRLSPLEYIESFVYDADFLAAHKITYNQKADECNSTGNHFYIYLDSIVVEYYFDFTLEDKNPLSWKNLKLVLEKYRDDWYLVNLIHGEWTI